MAANVESMFSVKQVPWHQQGEILEDYPTTDEAYVKSGLNWTVNKIQMSYNFNGEQKISSDFALVRDSLVLARVGTRFFRTLMVLSGAALSLKLIFGSMKRQVLCVMESLDGFFSSKGRLNWFTKMFSSSIFFLLGRMMEVNLFSP